MLKSPNNDNEEINASPSSKMGKKAGAQPTLKNKFQLDPLAPNI